MVSLGSVGRCGFAALVLALVCAGCDGGGEGASIRSTTTVEKCSGSKNPAVVRRTVAKVKREIGRIRALAAPIKKKTLDGTPALSSALDRFLVDVRDRDIPVHTRSRLIDRAASIVAPVCEQCFQALEANRPIAGGAKLGCG